MIKVFVYDDNAARIESLIALLDLADHMKFVGKANNCKQVEEDMRRAMPDVVLMDIEMPEVDGIQGVLRISNGFPEIKVIMQTVYENEDKIFQCLQHGAKGYILKKASAQQIIASIEEVCKGGAFMTPSVALKVMKYFQQPTAAASPLEQLTLKENEVLQHLSDGLSYKLIAEKMNIASGTVNNHLKKIYEKLQVHSAGEAISLMYKLKLK